MLNLTTCLARVILVVLCIIVLIMEGEEEMVERYSLIVLRTWLKSVV